MRALLADDDPHPRGPAAGVEQAGDVRDPGALPDLAAAVIGGSPRIGGNFADGGLDVLGDHHVAEVVVLPGFASCGGAGGNGVPV